jgi:hypothetical protein
VLTELREVSRRWWELAEHANRADLETSITAIVDVYRRHAAAFTAAVETATYDTSVAEELRMLVQEIIDATHTAIERGQTAGTIRDVATAEPPAVLTWMVERAGYQLVRGTNPSNDPKIVAVLTDIIWTTLYRMP